MAAILAIPQAEAVRDGDGEAPGVRTAPRIVRPDVQRAARMRQGGQARSDAPIDAAAAGS